MKVDVFNMEGKKVEQVELPAAKSPTESLAVIRVPAAFEVQLVAAEPLVKDPIDIAWGADGKLWVVEMADYPLGLDGKGKPGGRIRFLESTRGDGVYDKSTLFADRFTRPIPRFRLWLIGSSVVKIAV